jgi:hypothetical protein
MQNMKVYVYHLNGSLLGQGSTGTDGKAFVSFVWPGPGPGPVTGNIVVRFEEANGRWVIRNLGNAPVSRTVAVSLPYATNPEFPGARTVTLGTSAVPDPHANVFDGANKMWLNALSQSAMMATRFTGITIKTFTDPAGTDCETSCASAKEIRLDSDPGPYAPSMRIMHEMGHVANNLSHATNGVYDHLNCLTFPEECSFEPPTEPQNWFFTNPEWSSAAFEEGFATFHAAVGLYAASNPSPHVCSDAAIACATSFYNVESVPSCTDGTQSRSPASVTRYFWDAFDSVADPMALFPAGETATPVPFPTILDALQAFPDGTANGAESESVVTEDGRSLVDYRKYLAAPTSYYTTHCSPPGN